MLDLTKFEQVGSVLFEGESLFIYKTKKNPLGSQIGNRRLKGSIISALRGSFSERYMFTLIYVNEKLEILDGQHRNKVISDLDLNTYFIVLPGYGLEDTRRFQTQYRWVAEDVMNSYIKLGYKDYTILKDFKLKYGITSYGVAQQLLVGKFADSGITSSDFNKGNFIVTNLEIAEIYAQRLITYSKWWDKYFLRSFVVAMVSMFEHPMFNEERMLNAFEKYNTMLPAGDVGRFVFKNILSRMYNKNLNNKSKIAFVTDKEVLHKEVEMMLSNDE